MTDWDQATVASVSEGIFDGPHATPAPAMEGPVFLGIKNITQDGHLDLTSVRHISEEDFPRWTRRVQPQPADIVFTYEASLHRYAIVPPDFRGCLGRRTALVRPDLSQVEPRFLLYYFLSPEWRSTVSRRINIGSTVDRIPLAEFPAFPIRIPPLGLQRKIAAVLGAYDELIENNLRRTEILEGMAQAIYREWFVNLRYPGCEAHQSRGSSQESLATGWRILRLEEIADLHRGRSYKSENLVNDGGWPFLNLKCIDRDGGFRVSGIKRYDGPFKEHQKAQHGDIVIALTDMTQERRIVGRVGRVPSLERAEGVMSMDLGKLAPSEGTDPGWLYGMLRWSSFPDEVKQWATGVNVLHLSPDRVLEYRVLVPPQEIQNRYGERVRPLLDLADTLGRQNAKLAAARDLLLPRLISGETDLSNLDIDTSWLAA